MLHVCVLRLIANVVIEFAPYDFDRFVPLGMNFVWRTASWYSMTALQHTRVHILLAQSSNWGFARRMLYSLFSAEPWNTLVVQSIEQK